MCLVTTISNTGAGQQHDLYCQDIKSIMPTVLILIFTLLIMVTVIPYAFSNVIKQLQAVRLLEQQQEGWYIYF